VWLWAEARCVGFFSDTPGLSGVCGGGEGGYFFRWTARDFGHKRTAYFEKSSIFVTGNVELSGRINHPAGRSDGVFLFAMINKIVNNRVFVWYD
jgi:hypothetical protein